MANSSATLEKIVALCKRRGFTYQSSEIYGGLNGVYDFGPMGAMLRQNIKNSWLDILKNHFQLVFLCLMKEQYIYEEELKIFPISSKLGLKSINLFIDNIGFNL